MPHSPGPHKYPRTRIPPARRYLSGHVVVAARVPLSKARPLPTKEGVILRTVGEAANYPAEAQNLKMAQGVDVQIGRDRDRSRRNDSDVTVGIGSGGVTVGPRQNCRMVTTTVDRADGRSITRKERRCD
jgi:hypothetical protein